MKNLVSGWNIISAKIISFAISAVHVIWFILVQHEREFYTSQSVSKQ